MLIITAVDGVRTVIHKETQVEQVEQAEPEYAIPVEYIRIMNSVDRFVYKMRMRRKQRKALKWYQKLF